MTYKLLDSGDGEKLERFGSFTIRRPCQQAIWHPQGDMKSDATFSRDGGNRWTFHKKLPSSWQVEAGGVLFRVQPTDFGHLGLFPEHVALWDWMRPRLEKGMRLLNLFAYSGGATLTALQEGASVCHLDASRASVAWAKENAELNNLSKSPVRWIVDDVIKFLKREIRRGALYEGILLDPPTFGRGSRGECFKIEEAIVPLLELCYSLLSQKRRFLILSCHTPGWSPTVLYNLFSSLFPNVPVEVGELLLTSEKTLSIPSGSFARIAYA